MLCDLSHIQASYFWDFPTTIQVEIEEKKMNKLAQHNSFPALVTMAMVFMSLGISTTAYAAKKMFRNLLHQHFLRKTFLRVVLFAFRVFVVVWYLTETADA